MASPLADSKLNICIAPDYCKDNPYQQMLAEALKGCGCSVRLLSDYYRLMPLTRGLSKGHNELLHLHWPEAYFLRGDTLHRYLRMLRYPVDLALATRRHPLVMTAHNLLPHGQADHSPVRALMQFTYRKADAVIAHGPNSAAALIDTYKVKRSKIHEIPHGDLAAPLPPPIPTEQAKTTLGLETSNKLCLMFGAVTAYKGIDEVVAYWQQANPTTTLAVVGKPRPESYGQSLAALIDSKDVVFKRQWLTSRQFALWLSAADCAIFNYQRIFVSGAACLARSWGLPILVPERLNTLDIGEPDPHVLRFDSLDGNFTHQLKAACELGRDYPAATSWREATSWNHVAEKTAAVYRSLLQ